MRKVIGFVILFGLLVSACSAGGSVSTPTSSPRTEVVDTTVCNVPHSNPGPAVDVIQFSKQGVDQAANAVRSGEIDLYLAGLKLAAAEQIRNNDSVKSYRAPSGSIGLLLNPAPDPSGLNPFSLLKVRQAMQYLVDREFVANNLYGGNAIPQAAHISKLDYDYLTIADILASNGISYDPEFAMDMITKAMTEAGAELVNGKWNYNGRPIQLKFIIRVEDERREVGDTVKVALEKAGFEVITNYQQFAPAIMTVQSTDPQVFEWHLYTEGWGKFSADRYDFASINQFAAPWMANMPGQLIFGFWQYENDLLDELGQKIFMGDFSSRQERDELYREMTQIALDENVRVWVATTFNVFPANPDLRCVVEDITSGPKSIFTLREAYVPGEDTLRVGNFWVWNERSAWNTIGGFGDVFSVDIWKNINDPSLVNDPFSGRPIPFRADFQVETAGAGGGKLAVPDDAVVWNAAQDKWQSVPAGTQATSKVVFDMSSYFNSVWHNEMPITMADVVYNLAASFDRVYDTDKQRIEFVLAATQKPLLDVFRGFRVLDENRIEAYLDYWHFDEAYIASYADIFSLALPWEIMAASDELVYGRKQAAYSQASAARYNVPWLSLAEGRSAGLVARVLRGFARNSYVPSGVFDLPNVAVSSQDAKARYDAALEWFSKYDHLIISNGPFVLAVYDPPAQYAELRAFRHETYPFKPGDWYRQRPKDIAFTNVSAGSDTLNVGLSGTGELELRYVVIDLRSGEALASGVATKTSDSEFEIALTSDLFGRYQSGRAEVLLIASSDELARVYEYRAFK